MFAKINRIRKKKDFETIFRNSRIFKTPGVPFIFRLAKNNLGLNRFGFVVSQKISKKSVVRNKVRRRLAESIKTEINNIKKGTDLVLIALPGIEKKDFSQLKEAIHKICLNL